MSRVGKNEIKIPNEVVCTSENGVVAFKGKFGAQSYKLPELVKMEKHESFIKLTPKDTSMKARALWGTAQRTLSNMVVGVNAGFTVTMNLVGVGYRASVTGSKIVLQLGFSHDVEYVLPDGVTAKCDKPTELSITGSSKQEVGQIAAEI